MFFALTDVLLPQIFLITLHPIGLPGAAAFTSVMPTLAIQDEKTAAALQHNHSFRTLV